MNMMLADPKVDRHEIIWILLLIVSTLGATVRSDVVRAAQSQDKEVAAPAQQTPPSRAERGKSQQNSHDPDSQTASDAGTPVLSADPTATAREIEIGEMFEKQGRLADAEKAYAKALETASNTEREDARKHLRNVFAREEHFQDKYLTPSIEKANASFLEFIFHFVEAILFLAALWLGGKVIRRLGERRGNNKLQIIDFIDATGQGGAAALAEQMKNAVEQMQEYYRPRDRFRFGSFSSLLIVTAPSSDGSIDLVAEVISSTAGKLISFFTKNFFRPEYKVTGMVQKSGLRYICWVKLFRRDRMLASWERKFWVLQCPEMQEQLLFEVALDLKERLDANRD